MRYYSLAVRGVSSGLLTKLGPTKTLGSISGAGLQGFGPLHMVNIRYDAYIMQDDILPWPREHDGESRYGVIMWCRERHMHASAQPRKPSSAHGRVA